MVAVESDRFSALGLIEAQEFEGGVFRPVESSRLVFANPELVKSSIRRIVSGEAEVEAGDYRIYPRPSDVSVDALAMYVKENGGRSFRTLSDSEGKSKLVMQLGETILIDHRGEKTPSHIPNFSVEVHKNEYVGPPHYEADNAYARLERIWGNIFGLAVAAR